MFYGTIPIERSHEPTLRFSLRTLLLAPVALALLCAVGGSFRGGWVIVAFVGLTVIIAVGLSCLAYVLGRTPKDAFALESRISARTGKRRLRRFWRKAARPGPTWLSMTWFHLVVIYIVFREAFQYFVFGFAAIQGPPFWRNWLDLWSEPNSLGISPRALANSLNALFIVYFLVNVAGFLMVNGAQNRMQRIPFIIALEYLLVLQLGFP